MSGMRPHSAAHELSSRESNVPISGSSSKGFKISPRPATAGFHTLRSSLSAISAKNSIKSVDNSPNKDARSYFDNFKKEEQQELIAQTSASWLLSTDFRGQAGLPCGLISDLTLSQKQDLTLLFPKEKNIPELEYREIHQIVHDLTSGIFGVNQLPSLRFEPNFDLSSTCQLPLAYKNTKVGQVLISVDYAMKSLWHGACVSRSTRSKLAERWRTLLDVNSATGEFTTANQNVISEFDKAGQKYISSDPNFKGLYEELNRIDPSEAVSEKENKFFNQYSDFVRCVLTSSVSKIQTCSSENVIAVESTYDVTSAMTLPDHDYISPAQLQRLRRRLRHQLKMIRKGLLMDPSIRRNISLLNFISAVSLILVSLRRRLMRVPDVGEMLNLIQSDNIRTETELPPFAIGKPGDHPCEIFTMDGKGRRRAITHCHGEIQLDVDTPSIEPLSDCDWCHRIQSDAIAHLKTLFEKLRPEYSIPTVILDGKEHYVVHIPLTTYYSATPPVPGWLHSRYKMISSLRPKRLIMSDLQLAELFKQTFGFKKAMENKTTEGGLRLSACRGLVSPFITLMRKTASATLLSPDIRGFTLLHYACIHNRPDILCILLGQNPNLSTRRTEINPKSTRATALIFATRCGSLPCVTALLASKANPMLSDGQGWSAIHAAASSDQTPIIRSFLRRHPNLLETPGGDNATPLLVAASSGSLLSLQFLIEHGACIKARDLIGDGVIERAVLNHHADVIEYFVEEKENKKFQSLEIWKTFVDLLQSSSVVRQDAALRCLEVLLHRNPQFWLPLQKAGALPPLVNLLQSNKRRPRSSSLIHADPDPDDPAPSPIRSLACSVVCLMSEQDSVRKEVATSGAIPTLISMLKPVHMTPCAKHIRLDETSDERIELQSRSSVVLSDLACVDALCIAKHEGIPPLVDLLHLEVVDVLVNVVTALAALCRGDRSGTGDIQRRIMDCGAAGFFVEFLRTKDDALQTATADAVAAICHKNESIQNEFVSLGTYKSLITILRGHCISAQVKAAMAIDAMAEDNLDSQRQALHSGAPDALGRLLQIWSDTVKERGACALWALAGSHPEQQRAISNRIGTKRIIDMLISKSDTLQWIGCQAMAAISRNRFSGQNKLINDETIHPLVRLLRLPQTTRRVTVAVLDAMKCLCLSVAHVNNKKSQEILAEEGAIDLLLDRIWQTSRDESMQVDLLLCLAHVVSGCPKNEDKLAEIDFFDFDILLEILNSADLSVRFRASSTLALFSFNRLPQQQKILKLGGIPYFTLEAMLNCNDPMIRIGVAFQLVVLARVVAQMSVVDASARGIIVLVEALHETNDDDVIIEAERYVASLAHTRAGVPDAIVSAGAVAKLLVHLKSKNDLIRTGASQALGYLSFNRTASRELMATCRSVAGVYESLLENIGEDGKISDEFLAEFHCQKIVGLPISKSSSKNSDPKQILSPQLKQIKTTRPRTAKTTRKLPICPVLVTEKLSR